MAKSKHLISVHYHKTDHINLQEGGAAILSEPEGVQIHVLITIKLFVCDCCSSCEDVPCCDTCAGGPFAGKSSTHLLGMAGSGPDLLSVSRVKKQV